MEDETTNYYEKRQRGIEYGVVDALRMAWNEGNDFSKESLNFTQSKC